MISLPKLLLSSTLGLFVTVLPLTYSNLSAEETTLRSQLLERASHSKTPPEVKAKMTQHLKQISDSELVANALKKGDKAPDFKLKDHTGKTRALSEFQKEGPVILTWYRGGW